MGYQYRSSRAKSSRHRTNRGRTNNRAKRFAGQYIDPSRFVKEATPTKPEEYNPTHLFTDFDIAPLLQKNLADKGYVTPSPIQDLSIPVGLSGQDVIGIASTGTGKTAAFALPLINKLLSDSKSSALIVAPTRELALQIEVECRELSKGSSIQSVILIGGTNMGAQLRKLQGRPRIVIGTPGRIKDHIQRRSLKLHNCSMVVLDEVDRMLDMGFINDVREILSEIRHGHQSFFYSATMDEKIRQLITTFTHDAKTIMLQPSSTSDNVHQDVVHYTGSTEKIDKLHDLLIREDVSKALIFDETKRGVDKLNKELVTRGFSTDSIHGGKSQGQRQRALNKFKKNEVSVLVATDVAARGIDVADISHVINYSLPKVYDDYIHRIGRAGRAGNVGHALTFVTKDTERR